MTVPGSHSEPLLVLAGTLLERCTSEGSGGEVQTLTIEAATRKSGVALFEALSAFQPRWDKARGNYAVSVELGGDEHVLEVLAAIQTYLVNRADGDAVNAMVVALNDRRYTIHDR